MKRKRCMNLWEYLELRTFQKMQTSKTPFDSIEFTIRDKKGKLERIRFDDEYAMAFFNKMFKTVKL